MRLVPRVNTVRLLDKGCWLFWHRKMKVQTLVTLGDINHCNTNAFNHPLNPNIQSFQHMWNLCLSCLRVHSQAICTIPKHTCPTQSSLFEQHGHFMLCSSLVHFFVLPHLEKVYFGTIWLLMDKRQFTTQTQCKQRQGFKCVFHHM